jgi:FkbM family methyltransferase
MKGSDAKTQWGLHLSAVLDILSYIVCPSLASSPKVYVSGIVCFKFKEINVYFYVRKFSDDLYNILPGREGDVNDLMITLLKEDDVFVDVGANIGYYSILAGKIVKEQGRVIAVEPIPMTADVLKLNTRLNKLSNVVVANKALWDSRSRIKMWVYGGLYGCATVADPKGKPFLVDAIPLDDLCRDIQFIKLLKIDVEGSELKVLQGAKETLGKTKYLMVEMSKNVGQVLELLRQASFKTQKMRFTTYTFAYRCDRSTVLGKT